jgi:TonB family protein
MNKVRRFWNAPMLDRRSAANEIVVVFTILKNGSVPQDSVKVVQTCKIPSLDDSAVRAILQAQPFGPLPTQYSGNSIEIEFTFILRR